MKIFIFLVLSFWLFSCMETTKEDVWVIEDTKNIISDYGDTLQWSVKDARAVRDMYNQDNEDLQKEIQKSKGG